MSRDELIAILMRPAEHRIEENGRGGYRCKAGDFEVDWTSDDRTRIAKHCAGFVADAILNSAKGDLCECGHPIAFHATGLGCSGSHADSLPCSYYRPPTPASLSVNAVLTQ